MRQRKPKELEEKLRLCADVTEARPEARRGCWRTFFRERADANERAAGEQAANASPTHGGGRLFAEVGSGKGAFLLRKAAENPADFFVGMEARDGVALRALEKTAASGLKNLLFLRVFARDLRLLFAPGELSGLYLNFCDPWPKARHAKRRLTHAGYLDQYAQILRAGGRLEFKTDDSAFFAFSLAEMTEHPRLEVVRVSRDLHAENLPAGETTTEYEEKFRLLNRPIYYVAVAAPPRP